MKKKFKNENQINRFEKKWVVSNTTHIAICLAFYKSNFFFRDLYPTRKINTIYYDDSKLTSLRENIDGTYDKTKYRIRWYGEKDQIINPQFEVKKKKRTCNSKKKYMI